MSHSTDLHHHLRTGPQPLLPVVVVAVVVVADTEDNFCRQHPGSLTCTRNLETRGKETGFVVAVVTSHVRNHQSLLHDGRHHTSVEEEEEWVCSSAVKWTKMKTSDGVDFLQ